MLVNHREYLVEDCEAVPGLRLGDRARRHNMHAVEVRKRHEAALLALGNELVHRWRGAAIRGERLAGLPVGDEVKGPEDAKAASLADDRVLLLQCTKARTKDVLAE